MIGFTPRRARRPVELDGREQVPALGDRKGRYLRRDAGVDEGPDANDAVDQRVLGAQAEVNESGRHGGVRAGGPDSNALCPPASHCGCRT